MAKLHPAAGCGGGRDQGRPDAGHGPHRSALRALCRTPGPRLPGRPEATGAPLLPQLCVARLRRIEHGAAGEVSLERARALVLEHGWNATSYQIINPGIRHWFSAAGDAVVGYVEAAGVRVVAGAPVASLQRLGDVAAEFEAESRRSGLGVCYFGAEERLENLYRHSPRHSMALLGAQPAWDPRHWAGNCLEHASLRAQFHRAHNKGVTVEEWPVALAEEHPA